MNIKNYIINKSKELSIDMIGFTDCEPMVHLEEYLNDRIKNKKNTEFEELDIPKRINPMLTLPSCKSIIVIALSYHVDYKEKNGYEIKGSLSKSSWGLDYHKVLKLKLEQLIDEIKKEVEFEYKYFVDTGPLIDRELAKKSGIGYYGKNCNIINDEYGSFIFIGYILTDLEIERDAPCSNECGDCELCLKACPTNALEEAYRLNPRRCISYLTQSKDEIDPNLKKNMGIKIYGCDTCQLVCPKNKDIQHSKHQEFIPTITRGAIDIKDLLTISNKKFKEKYGSMSGSWRGKNILKRNAFIALENMNNEKHKQFINELKNDINK